MGFGIHSVILIAAITLLGAIACIVFACRVSTWLKRSILIMVTLVLLAPSAFVAVKLKPELVDGRFRTYKRLYRDICVGMSRSEVIELVDRHYPAGGNRPRPRIIKDSDARLDFFMNPENSTEPNCEGIFLQMQEDKVVKKSYSAD